MPLAVWKDAYRTGDEIVDGQHQELFALINRLHDAIVAGRDRMDIASRLDQLGVQVSSHLQAEEKVMLAHGYPGLAAHKAKHDLIGSSVAKVIDDFRSGRAVLTIALSRFLADWLRHHLDGEDKAMIDFMQQRQT